jgi:hypothetical protein
VIIGSMGPRFLRRRTAQLAAVHSATAFGQGECASGAL